MKSLKAFRVLYHLLFLCSISFLSCNFPGQDIRNIKHTQAGEDSKSADSLIEKLAGGTVLKVIPGTSIGRLQLKMEVDRSPAFKILGTADSSDAAMCKSWAMWYWKDAKGIKKEFDLYATCDPDVDMKKTIQILRIEGAAFLTARGTSEKSSVKAIREQYPDVVSLGKFTNASGAPVMLWEDSSAGIAFELPADEKSISAVIIHEPGKKVTDTYLPFYKRIDN